MHKNHEQFRRYKMVLNRQVGLFVAGLMLMGMGMIFLIAQILGGNFWGYFWPFPIIAIGLTFFYFFLSGGRGSSGLAIPGSIITTIGVILMLQNSFGWWESWAFAWTFIIISVGVGIFLMGLRSQSEGSQRAGLLVAGIGVLLALPFGIFFGLGFSFLGFGFASRVIWPLMLLAGGAFLALRGVVAISHHSAQTTPTTTELSLPEPKPIVKAEEPAQNIESMQNIATPTQSLAV
jgi:hypothetical protein